MNRSQTQPHPAVAARLQRLRRQRGFSMIEVLVTVLILAIGLLGLAGLQSTSLRSNHSAYLRSQATVLAYDIADRIRANRTAALNGDYTVALGGGSGGSGMAATDVDAWKANLAALLPLGDGSVARAGNIFTITVQWDDRRGEDSVNESIQAFTLRTEL